MHAKVSDYSQSVQQLHTNNFIRNNSVNLNTIKQLCHEQVTQLNFDYISYLGYNPVSEETYEISTFPDDWSEHNRSLYGLWGNPVATFSQNRNTPFLWQDSIADPRNKKDSLADFLTLAEKYGVYNGICFPIHGAGAERGMLNIARCRNLRHVSLESVEILQLYALTVHEAVKRTLDGDAQENEKQKMLSPRERECLNWIAAGKTAWETAKIIGVTESTVSFHIRNTIVKLNAKNRAQAVAVAMARSLIKSPYRNQIHQPTINNSYNN